MKKNEIIKKLNFEFYNLGYEFFKYEKKSRVYRKIRLDNSIDYIYVNMETGVISKRSIIYNNINKEEFDVIRYISHIKLIDKIKKIGD